MYGKMLNEKKEMARVINKQYEENKFDFVPKINKKSEKIVQEKNRYLQSNVNYPPIEAGGDGRLASPKNLRNLEEQMKNIGMTNISSHKDDANSPPEERSHHLIISPISAANIKERKFFELYDEAKLRKDR